MRRRTPRIILALGALLAAALATLPAAAAAPAGDELEADVQAAEQDVVACFRSYGLEPPWDRLVDDVTVFPSPDEARRVLARRHRIPVAEIPPTFSGTVEGRTLYVISRDAYERLWRSLYPDAPWSEETYRQLIAHELTHKAHENWARARFGTIDAMGPAWFYEGFAVACAGQFPDQGPALSAQALRAEIGGGRTPAGSYPEYGRIVRALAAAYGMEAVLDAAARPDFPDALWARDRR
ncbi:hypothetical protein [Caulobacter sp. 17J65-9]|uniref:hypothetical protein n=1 Tax=Caulobacter sp. 17J65-9 TaxID=2709382 RepID=UPI0013C57574|nr:hypothetical protein [Caulobacter sp. 17J65-9]NEX93319.1 hypothetical protein [Caulobacter sp. 17J65-9]